MPQLRDEDKPTLLDEQMSLRKAQVGWAAVLAGTAPFTSHVMHLPSALCGVMIALLKRQEIAVDRALTDPARNDFETSTRSRPRRYFTGHLGRSPLAVAVDEAAEAILRTASHFEAMVRADERALGARARGAGTTEAQRRGEAERFVAKARLSQADMAARVAFVGRWWWR